MTSVVHQNLERGAAQPGIFKDLVSRPSGAIGLSLVIFHIALALSPSARSLSHLITSYKIPNAVSLTQFIGLALITWDGMCFPEL